VIPASFAVFADILIFFDFLVLFSSRYRNQKGFNFAGLIIMYIPCVQYCIVNCNCCTNLLQR
jgi:hypothetical protein